MIRIGEDLLVNLSRISSIYRLNNKLEVKMEDGGCHTVFFNSNKDCDDMFDTIARCYMPKR